MSGSSIVIMYVLLNTAVTALLRFPVLVPQVVVWTDRVQSIEMLVVSTPLVIQVMDVLSVALGHTPQFVAMTLYPIILSGQTDWTGSHWKVNAFLPTWARWTLSEDGAACKIIVVNTYSVCYKVYACTLSCVSNRMCTNVCHIETKYIL